MCVHVLQARVAAHYMAFSRQMLTADFAYVRMHGIRELHKDSYTGACVGRFVCLGGCRPVGTAFGSCDRRR
jgi:hypothetical protein